MSYLESAEEWDDFWAEHERALAGERSEITFDGHALGKTYPYQPDTRPQATGWGGSSMRRWQPAPSPTSCERASSSFGWSLAARFSTAAA